MIVLSGRKVLRTLSVVLGSTLHCILGRFPAATQSRKDWNKLDDDDGRFEVLLSEKAVFERIEEERPPLRPFFRRLEDFLWKLGDGDDDDIDAGLFQVYLFSKASPPLGGTKSNKLNSLPDPTIATPCR